MSDQAINLEVSNLVARYADYCDQRNWDGVVSLFAADGEFDADSVYGKTMIGSGELKDFFTSAPEAKGHHPTSFYCTEISDTSVSVRMKMIVIFRPALFSVDYAWTLKRIDGDLRIARQTIALVGRASLGQAERASS